MVLKTRTGQPFSQASNTMACSVVAPKNLSRAHKQPKPMSRKYASTHQHQILLSSIAVYSQLLSNQLTTANKC